MSKQVLIKSTSGIRGIVGQGLDAVLAAQYGAAFGTFLKGGRVVVGRDSRPSGEMLVRAVVSGLASVGINVIEIGIVPTPTVEIAVKKLRAAGGICVTASHNPAPWNAFKFFNHQGEFITPVEYRRLDRIFNSGKFAFKPVGELGRISRQDVWIDTHIEKTLARKLVNKTAIKRRKFKVVVDATNGAGSDALPLLMERLGVRAVRLYCDGDGKFIRGPEPVPQNLTQLGRLVRYHKADLGLACDPDADRLALVDENGHPIGEELTLAIAVRQVLKKKRGATVINLSTSSVTADTARAAGSKVYYSKVGESNVVQMMRQRDAVIGGEGNGGVIFPAFHAGRDSLIGAALVLSCLAEEKLTLSQLVETFPVYYTIKSKAPLPGNFKRKLARFENEARRLFGKAKIDRRDGLRFDFDRGWLQIRSSNTEPIYRLIIETDEKKLGKNLQKSVTEFFS